MSKHLWEVKHAYYCSDNNYYWANQPIRFDSWREFACRVKFGIADMNYDLVFRWDWYDSANSNYYRLTQDELHIYIMRQGQGQFMVAIVKVNKEDEQSVIEWLKPRFAHLVKLWQPMNLDEVAKDEETT